MSRDAAERAMTRIGYEVIGDEEGYEHELGVKIIREEYAKDGLRAKLKAKAEEWEDEGNIMGYVRTSRIGHIAAELRQILEGE